LGTFTKNLSIIFSSSVKIRQNGSHCAARGVVCVRCELGAEEKVDYPK